MASFLSSLEEDLTCAVCCEMFSEPVLLSCSHSFCRKCLQESWKDKEKRECPVCRQQSTSEEPPLNLALKNACEYFAKERSLRVSRTLRGVCPVHNGTLELFCVDDKSLVCLECVAQDHQDHNFCSISKVARERRGILKCKQHILEANLNLVKSAKHTHGNHFQSQVAQTENQIKKEFEKLHQFLREEEEARIAVLKEEVEPKKQKMNEKIAAMEKVIESLTEHAEALKEGIACEDVPFLNRYEEMIERTQYTMPDLKLGSASLIDVAKHLGNLRFKVWEKMKDICPYFPVILDPNSANGRLTLSEDLSKLTAGDTSEVLPNNPERFLNHAAVLGSEGFISGFHSWEVDLGNDANWIIGVAKASVNKAFHLGSFTEGIYVFEGNALTTFGFWPRRIRVQVDCTKQIIQFYDILSKGLGSHHFQVGEKLYPFFWAKHTQKSSMYIRSSEVTVNMR